MQYIYYIYINVYLLYVLSNCIILFFRIHGNDDWRIIKPKITPHWGHSSNYVGLSIYTIQIMLFILYKNNIFFYINYI